MSVILDTNAYSAMRKGHETVVGRLRREETVILSSVVIGELMFGFRNGTHYEKNRSLLDAFLAEPNVEITHVTLETADRYGRVSASLKRRGRPIPTNDIWLAAHAFETGAELLTFDDHFACVEGLIWTKLEP